MNIEQTKIELGKKINSIKQEIQAFNSIVNKLKCLYAIELPPYLNDVLETAVKGSYNITKNTPIEKLKVFKEKASSYIAGLTNSINSECEKITYSFDNAQEKIKKHYDNNPIKQNDFLVSSLTKGFGKILSEYGYSTNITKGSEMAFDFRESVDLKNEWTELNEKRVLLHRLFCDKDSLEREINSAEAQNIWDNL